MAQGGVTLGLEQGEPGVDFTPLGSTIRGNPNVTILGITISLRIAREDLRASLYHYAFIPLLAGGPGTILLGRFKHCNAKSWQSAFSITIITPKWIVISRLF